MSQEQPKFRPVITGTILLSYGFAIELYFILLTNYPFALEVRGGLVPSHLKFLTIVFHIAFVLAFSSGGFLLAPTRAFFGEEPDITTKKF